MSHNTLTTPAPERDEWGAPKLEPTTDDWNMLPATAETEVPTERGSRIKRLGIKIAPKFFEHRDIQKGYTKLEKIRAAKFRPLDQKPVFKHGSKESMLVGLEEHDDWTDAHAMNKAYDAAKRVDEIEEELARDQQNLAETKKNPIHSSTLEELDAGRVASTQFSLAAAKRIAGEANQRAWSTDELLRDGRDYTEEQLGLRPASRKQDSEDW